MRDLQMTCYVCGVAVKRGRFCAACYCKVLACVPGFLQVTGFLLALASSLTAFCIAECCGKKLGPTLTHTFRFPLRSGAVYLQPWIGWIVVLLLLLSAAGFLTLLTGSLLVNWLKKRCRARPRWRHMLEVPGFLIACAKGKARGEHLS